MGSENGSGQARRGDGLAIASIVTGSVGLAVCGLGLVLGPVGIGLAVASAKRSRWSGLARWGVGLGIAGAVTSVLTAVIAGVVVASGGLDDWAAALEDQTASARAESIVTPSDLDLTEQSVARSGYATAIEEWAATFDAHGVLDGMYDGRTIDTPCFSFDGAQWWVVGDDPDRCAPSNELWWQEASGQQPTITMFGVGAEGAAIVVDPVPADFVAAHFATMDLDEIAAYLRDDFLPADGLTDITTRSVTLGGQPAVALDARAQGLDAYTFYAVVAPHPYTRQDGSTVQVFFFHVYNEAAWVNSMDDMTRRLETTFTWK